MGLLVENYVYFDYPKSIFKFPDKKIEVLCWSYLTVPTILRLRGLLARVSSFADMRRASFRICNNTR